MSTEILSPAAIALRRIEADVATGNVAVYRDLIGQPCVTFPITGPAGDTPIHRPLFDRDFRGWLTIYIWRQEVLLLREREVEQVLLALAGASLERKTTQIADPALWATVEGEPSLVVLLEYMHARNGHREETSMQSLWQNLHQFAVQRGMVKRNGKCFPGGTNVLSRKLAEYKDVLERLGIKVTVRRSNGCKVVIERLDDSGCESSAESSSVNPGSGHDLRPSDDRMLRLLAIKQRTEVEMAESHQGEMT